MNLEAMQKALGEAGLDGLGFRIGQASLYETDVGGSCIAPPFIAVPVSGASWATRGWARRRSRYPASRRRPSGALLGLQRSSVELKSAGQRPEKARYMLLQSFAYHDASGLGPWATTNFLMRAI